jgi:hypothetical protein
MDVHEKHTSEYKYPLQSALRQRINTFWPWPQQLQQNPYDLAKAGFFYFGVGDQVICYHCGIGVTNWEDDDIPWEEHAYLQRDCPLVIMEKGQDFINKVIECKERCKLNGINISFCDHSIALGRIFKNKNIILNSNNVEDVTTSALCGQNACIICKINPPNFCFIECGHVNVCESCLKPDQDNPKLYYCIACKKNRHILKIYY